VETLVVTDDEFHRVLSGCATQYCLDTGHLTIGGGDVVSVARSSVDRIGLVHLKDVDGAVTQRERTGELDLMAATQAGLFPPLGGGVVPIADVVDALETAAYDSWYVMETDVAPTGPEPLPGEGPVRGVARISNMEDQ
ncbi:MAG: TIM barrel protein, partial [Actinomycetota bacterium]|nr:TIM barrel protein [Actinomycetota bacterium]